MTGVDFCTFGLASFSLVYWSGAAWSALRMGAVKEVDSLPPVTLPRWPRVSLIIPACNEEGTLATALASRLADNYPELEIVVIDDRSSDATGAIADEFARQDPRVRVIHLDALPDGWLGKLHAMQRGAAVASGEFLLLSDADTHWVPGTLRRIIARCEAARLDHLTVFPTMWSAGLALDAATAALTVVAVGGGVDRVAGGDGRPGPCDPPAARAVAADPAGHGAVGLGDAPRRAARGPAGRAALAYDLLSAGPAAGRAPVPARLRGATDRRGRAS